ncbi:O-antigen ligase family protein [Patescibacteria group bacterium]|nr:O-antigen ligase family protein [Patescibacteria group bacterium]MBU1673834.1 O-antigen ligase family protein [Patescibacteria group bacterium]MBU1963609.1 O-antigen ligase family protein [Patescibacteria group bacterium]
MEKIKFFGKTFQNIFLVIIGIEILSIIGFYFPSLNPLFFIIAVLLFFIISIKRLDYGVYLLLAELFIGSKGYLLEFPIGGFDLSLRLGIFLALFVAFIYWAMKEKQITFFKIKLWKYFLAFMIVIGLGAAIGYLRGNPLANIFFDWNGYLYFGLIFPFAQAINSKERFLNLFQVLAAGVLASAAKTLILLFLFSHPENFLIWLPNIYRWVRDTGVGEITELPNHFFRIFFQSHIYSVIFLIISFVLLNHYRDYIKSFKKYFKSHWSLLLMCLLSMTLLFLCYSRSFWIGAFVTFVLIFGFLFFKLKYKFSRVVYLALWLIMGAVLSVGLTFVIINFPTPGEGTGISAASLIKERTSDTGEEAAARSRFNLVEPMTRKFIENPIIGSGFGTSVKYESADPRAVAASEDGLFETFSFEWGWLDFLLKIGILGTFVYLLLLFMIFKLGLKIYNTSRDPLILGSLFALFAVALIHALTPYLNHPLGIGWILIVALIPTIYSAPSKNLK